MTSEERRIDRSGIHIERDVAESVAIEEDLDANVARAYRFPSPERRRMAGWVYLVIAVLALMTIDHWGIAAALVAVAAWHFVSSWPLNVDESKALGIAGSAVPFPVGHASASVRFQGWRSRPRWAVVLYAATEPPDERALVVVDAVDGRIVEPPFVEEIAPV